MIYNIVRNEQEKWSSEAICTWGRILDTHYGIKWRFKSMETHFGFSFSSCFFSLKRFLIEYFLCASIPYCTFSNVWPTKFILSRKQGMVFWTSIHLCVAPKRENNWNKTQIRFNSRTISNWIQNKYFELLVSV